MRLHDEGQSNVFSLASERRKVDATALEGMVKGILTSIEELEERNRDLVQRNAQLESALKQANERMARYEEVVSAKAEQNAAVLHRVVKAIGGIERTIASPQRGANHEGARRYTDAARRILDLQKEVIVLLNKARDEMMTRDQETDQCVSELLRDARQSILTLAEDAAPSAVRTALSDRPAANDAHRHDDAPARALVGLERLVSPIDA